MRFPMRWTSWALASARSGLARPRSANTLPLPGAKRSGSSRAAFVLPPLFLDPFRILVLLALPDEFRSGDFFRHGVASYNVARHSVADQPANPQEVPPPRRNSDDQARSPQVA